MAQSLTPSSYSHYHHPSLKITPNNRHETCETKLKTTPHQVERLNFKDIQNITKSMMKDRKAHQHNVGVLQNIKGKLYCLKLGEMSNFKQFSHFFYTSQYRRKQQKSQMQLKGRRYPAPTEETRRYPSLLSKESKNLGLQSQNLPQILSKQIKQQLEQINKVQQQVNSQFQLTNWQQIQIDQKLKQKVNKFMFPILTINNSKQNKEANDPRKRKQSRGFSVTKML